MKLPMPCMLCRTDAGETTVHAEGCATDNLLQHAVQGDDVFPIPGTRAVSRLEENVAAAHIRLSKADLDELEAA